MGFRFQKRFKIAPGVKINLSKSGISTSVGRPGATFNVGTRGTKSTIGVPGTGVSYSVEDRVRQAENDSGADAQYNRAFWAGVLRAVGPSSLVLIVLLFVLLCWTAYRLFA